MSLSDASDLRGDVTGLRGNASGLRGDINNCELTFEERAGGIDIALLINGVIYLTNAINKITFKRQAGIEDSYLLRFLGFACTFGLCGVGGVASILRSTSVSLGCFDSLRLSMMRSLRYGG